MNKSKHPLVPGRMSEPMTSGVACTPARSILAEARANGVKRYTVGLTDLLVSVRPVERLGRGKAPIVSGGREITITPVGKPISADAAAALLEWATEYVTQGAT